MSHQHELDYVDPSETIEKIFDLEAWMDTQTTHEDQPNIEASSNVVSHEVSYDTKAADATSKNYYCPGRYQQDTMQHARSVSQ